MDQARVVRMLLFAGAAALWAGAAQAAKPLDIPKAKAAIEASLDKAYPHLDAVYKDIHAHPELALQETRTAALLAKEMRALGFEVTEHVGKTGVVAVMKNGPGPVLLIRADMDALPVTEQTGLPFASKVRANPGLRNISPALGPRPSIVNSCPFGADCNCLCAPRCQ